MLSWALHNGARRLLLWAHAHGVSLRAVYQPEKDNVAANVLSRGGPLPGEWRLHLDIVQAIWSHFGRAQVDFFASRETTHCPWWYSMLGPKGTLGVDALAYTFSPLPSPASGVGQSENVVGQGASGGPGLASSALNGRASDNAGVSRPGRTCSRRRGACCGIRNQGFTGCMFGPWAAI